MLLLSQPFLTKSLEALLPLSKPIDLSMIDFPAPVSPVIILSPSQNSISGKIAKTVFEEMFSSGEDPEKIVEEQGLKQITDTNFLKDLVKSVLDSNPEQVQEYKSGKQKVFGFFVGKVMKETQGKANPAEVNSLLKEMLK